MKLSEILECFKNPDMYLGEISHEELLDSEVEFYTSNTNEVKLLSVYVCKNGKICVDLE